jgi:hypothetical protein
MTIRPWAAVALPLSLVIGIFAHLQPASTSTGSLLSSGLIERLGVYTRDAIGMVWSWPISLLLATVGLVCFLSSFLRASERVQAALRTIGLVSWVTAWMPLPGLFLLAILLMTMYSWMANHSPGFPESRGDVTKSIEVDIFHAQTRKFRSQIKWIFLFFLILLLPVGWIALAGGPGATVSLSEGGGANNFYAYGAFILLLMSPILLAALFESLVLRFENNTSR